MIIIGKLKELGEELRAVRKLKRLSRDAVARPAKISAAYLQKLEEGVVKNPSPRVLHRVAEVLQVSYAKLMELAGYAVPGAEEGSQFTKSSPLQQALQNEDLTEQELRAVAAFVTYLKEQRN